MKESFLNYLACPKCSNDLIIENIEKKENNRIESGELKCSSCKSQYPILNYIPRFVPIENYASSFGHEWIKHSRTQYDEHSGIKESEVRFFDETKWSRKLEGEVILEVGSGSGRFTEHAASTGAFVVTMDYSYAVEANYQSNGHKDNVFIVQGDIYEMPFKKHFFDKLVCIGVLQHTPDPKKAFMSLPPFLKNNGKLVIDIYKKTIGIYYLGTRYWVRPLTRNAKDPQKLYDRIKSYVNFMWPLTRIISKIPVIGYRINWRLMIADSAHLGLKGDMLKEWTYLETFDVLSPRYDYPQTLSTMKNWFNEAGLKNSEVHYGYNGIEGRGTMVRNQDLSH